MIGVISESQEREVVEEFFQLFKTPWEFFAPGRCYDVVIATGQNIPEIDTSLFVIFGTERCKIDKYELAEVGREYADVFIRQGKVRLPIYGKAITFSNADQPFLFCSNSGRVVGYETRRGAQRILRIGYDFFEEISYLLSEGQPLENALIPTLDLHIGMLRRWMIETGIGFVEIPPIPRGYRLIACLTHDVDFVGIRKHFLDQSMFGFLYRATLGSILDIVKGRTSLGKLRENLKTVLFLPLVFLGIWPDPWEQFDRCLEIERDVRSTFFFVPFKKKAGRGFCKGKGKRRAVKYDVKDASLIIQKLLTQGKEIGVHGIDAWHSIDDGKQELHRLKEELPGQHKIGIRMHWLFRNGNSSEVLDKSGFSYDSTVGYNETVGFKAGTAQVFKPIGAEKLLEIPLIIQDTALLGRGRRHASEAYANELCCQIINHCRVAGGAVTVLWHQRSLGPERLWGNFYAHLIKKMETEKAWFATATDITNWFWRRRKAGFEQRKGGNYETEIVVEPVIENASPELFLRRYPRWKGVAAQSKLIT